MLRGDLTNLLSHTHTHTHTRTHTRTHTHTHTHARTHTHTHIRTYTHTRTHTRSSSDPYTNADIEEGFRASPDPFKTYPGHMEGHRSTSPPPWFIAEPHTPLVPREFQVRREVEVHVVGGVCVNWNFGCCREEGSLFLRWRTVILLLRR